MPLFEWGPNPDPLKIRLAEDADFRLFLRIPEVSSVDGSPLDPWPVGISVTIRFIRVTGDPIIWPATIDPNDARRLGWDVDKAVTRPVLDEFRAGNIKAARWFIEDDYMGKGVVKDVT